jgi:hypothetical protein
MDPDREWGWRQACRNAIRRLAQPVCGLEAARTTAEAPRRPSEGTAAPLRLIVREDFAVLYVGPAFGNLVGVDGGNELGQLA